MTIISNKSGMMVEKTMTEDNPAVRAVNSCSPGENERKKKSLNVRAKPRNTARDFMCEMLTCFVNSIIGGCALCRPIKRQNLTKGSASCIERFRRMI